MGFCFDPINHEIVWSDQGLVNIWVFSLAKHSRMNLDMFNDLICCKRKIGRFLLTPIF